MISVRCQACCQHCELAKEWYWARQCRFRLEFSSSRRASARLVTILTCPTRGNNHGQTGHSTKRLWTIGAIKQTSPARRNPMPEMIFVDSTSLEAVGYDGHSQELHVR